MIYGGKIPAEVYIFKDPMWQASNTGSVKGVNGNVDIDYLYKDYTQIIPAIPGGRSRGTVTYAET